MSKGSIGIMFQGLPPAQTLEAIVRADVLGVPTWWAGSGRVGPDALTLFGAAAARTKSIRLGTAIVPMYPRHPFVVAQQAQVISNLAPGRLVLGIGPGAGPTITESFGIPFKQPLQHLGDYVTVLKGILHTGTVQFDSLRFHVNGQIPFPSPIPVMVSALQTGSFRLAGRVSDGAISYLCPARYLRDVAVPAMREGAAQTGRPGPPLVGHAFIALSKDTAAVARAVRNQLAFYLTSPSYSKMFSAAGHPEAQRGEWSDAMIDAVVIHGDEAEIAAGLQSFMDMAGATEMFTTLLAIKPDPQDELEQAMKLLCGL